MRLYGNRVIEEEMAKEVSRLLLGDPNTRQEPLSVSEAARALGYSRNTVYRYVKKAVEKYHLLGYDNNGRIVLPENTKLEFQRFDKKHEIMHDHLVAEWKQDLLTRKGGEPLASWKTRIRALESVCNSCKVTPRELLISQRQTEKILKNYAQIYIEGNVDIDPRGRKRSHDIKNVIYKKAQAVRDFCGFYGMMWKRGTGGVMSQKVPNHGKYADIRLTDAELEQADRFIKEKWGLDSDIYRWFWVGIESCSRFEALYAMNLDYTKHIGKTGKTTYIMTAYESKTKHIRGGKWIKYITRADTQKSIDLLKARNGTRIYEVRIYKLTFRKQMSQSLVEIYRQIGKKNYFEDRPTHTLRHVGAHYWLARKNYNYGLVALIGGWHTIDELRKSYGEMPPEKVLEMIEGDSGIISLPLLH
jgi:Mn-dependent DtxR family transcriptional regulator